MNAGEARRTGGVSAWVVRALTVPLGVGALLLVRAPIESADRGLYDAGLRWLSEQRSAEAGPYVFVEIDDRSIQRLGRFPWSRGAFAEFLERTRAGGAAVVGLDVLFAEPADSAGDAALEAALEVAGNVYLASAPVLERGAGDGGLLDAERLVDPLPRFASASAGVGSITIVEDEDGSTRRYPLLVAVGGAPYPSLAQVMAGAVASQEIEAVLRGDGTMLVNYASLPPGSVGSISFSDVLDLDEAGSREVFEGKIVLVGATYTGGVDVGPTPLAPRTPAPLVHVFAIGTLLTGEHLYQVPPGVPFLLALLLVGLLSTQVPARHPLPLLALGLGLAGVFAAGAAGMLLWRGVFLRPALPLLATGLFVSGYAVHQWWATNGHLRRRNRELQDALETLRQTRSAKERMEAELDVAREIQFSMLPLEFPPFPERNEFELHAALVPAREVGGDFYDYFLVDEHLLCVCIADVSGKGVPAALFMAVSKVLLKNNAADSRSTAEIVSRANEELAEDNHSAMFVTVWLGLLDVRTGRLTYTNAGHNPPYVRTAAGDLVRLDARHGPVVAAIGGVEFGEATLDLAEGDTLLLYTDGVSEAQNSSGELYEEHRLRDSITRAPDSVTDLVEAATSGVWSFQGSAPQADDVTVVALRWKGAGGDGVGFGASR